MDSYIRKLIILLGHVFVVLIPLWFWPYTSELFEFNKLILVYAFAIVISTLWLTRMAVAGKILFKRTKIDLFILLFFVSQLISTIVSLDPYTSFYGYYSRFHGGLLSLIAYISLFYAFVSNVRPKEMMKLLNTTVYAGLITAVYAIPEHFGSSFSCYAINGSLDVSCWVQDVRTRIFGSMGQPNWLATYLLMGMFVSFGVGMQHWMQSARSVIKSKLSILSFRSTRSTLFIITNLISSGAMALAIIYTKSRSAFLGVGAGYIFMILGWLLILFTRAKSEIGSVQRLLIGFGSISIMMIILLFTAGQPLIDSVFTRLSGFIDQETEELAESTQVEEEIIYGTQLDIGGSESGEIRQVVWKGAIEVWKRYPLFGSGVETFAYAYYLDRPIEHNLLSEWDFLYNKAHNEFLNYLATSGAVGLITYLLLSGSVLVMIVRVGRKTEYGWIMAGLFGAFVGMHGSNALGFSTVAVTVSSIILMSVVSVFDREIDQKESETNSLTTRSKHHKKKLEKLKKSTSINTTQLYLVGPILVTGVFGLVWVWRYFSADLTYAQAKQLGESGDPITGISLIEKAIEIRPLEPMYYDELAYQTSIIVRSVGQEDATLAGQLATIAVQYSDRALELNANHLNLYRSRIRTMVLLSEFDEQYFDLAIETSTRAIQLAPTDPKLLFNRGLIYEQQGNLELAIQDLTQAVLLKPNYLPAKEQLARLESGYNQ